MSKTDHLKEWQIKEEQLYHLHGEKVQAGRRARNCSWDPTNKLWFCPTCQVYAPPAIQLSGRLVGVNKGSYRDNVTGY